MAGAWRIRHKLLFGLFLVVGIMAILSAGTLEGLRSYRSTMQMIDTKLAELRAVNDIHAAMRELATQGRKLSPQAQAALDEALKQTERAMMRDEGLPRRAWFKHQIYAPGFYTGYGVKTLPAVREAIEQRSWTEAEQQITPVAQTINAIAAAIDRATALVKQG